MRASAPRVIVALDHSDVRAVHTLVSRLAPGLCRLKVGSELFTAHGPSLVEYLVRRDFDVFLDLKFHDIPNTVARACAVAADLGVWMVNVHASGGRRMLLAAREAIERSHCRPFLVAVTLLTSLAEAELAELGLPGSPLEAVGRLARLAKSCQLDGVVCSPLEAAHIRRAQGTRFVLVTPGVRLDDAPRRDDQRRVMSPAAAVAAGADYLVIGRPITRAPNPLEALARVNAEIDSRNGAARLV